MPRPLDSARLPVPSIQLHCKGCALASLCLPAALTAEELELLQPMIRHTRPLAARSHVFRAGDAVDGAHVVRTGVVKTYRTAADGREQTVGLHFPGEFFGLESLGQEIHTTSAVVLESAALCSVPVARVFALSTLPATAAYFLRLLAARINDQQAHMLQLSQRTAEERVAAFLVDLSLRYRRSRLSGTWMHVPMSRGELSNYLGLVIETVSRVLMRLQRIGIIRLANRDLELLDVAQLYALARMPLVGPVTHEVLPFHRLVRVAHVAHVPQASLSGAASRAAV